MLPELLDYYDTQNQWIGTATRQKVHQEGLWHRVFHCWVQVQHDGQPCLLFQKRSPDKANHPNRLDISVGGHYQAGEQLPDGLRELEEELGIVAQWADLQWITLRTDSSQTATDWNNEFCYTYWLHYLKPLTSLRLQVGEVAAVVPVPLTEGLAWLQEGALQPLTATAYYQQNETWTAQPEIFTQADLVPHPLAYYVDVFALAANR